MPQNDCVEPNPERQLQNQETNGDAVKKKSAKETVGHWVIAFSYHLDDCYQYLIESVWNISEFQYFRTDADLLDSTC